MTEHLGAIVSRLRSAIAARSPVLVGVDGPGGAGKTVLAAALADRLGAEGLACAVVHFDDFYLPAARRPCGIPERQPVGGAFDWVRLRDDVLAPLRAGRDARYRRHDWTRDALAGTQEVAARGIVVVEGVTCTRRELAGLYDVRVWVECPREERLARGLRRDGEAARGRWELEWMPAEDRYVREHAPDRVADFVVPGTSA